MNDSLKQALDEISDKHIAEAAAYRKRNHLSWLAPIAAILILAVLVSTLQPSMLNPPSTTPSAPLVPTQSTTPPGNVIVPLTNLLAAREYPVMAQLPNYAEGMPYEEYIAAHDVWQASQKSQYNQPGGYANSLGDFWARSIPEFLSGEGNQACSPLNIYMALTMLAETAGGNSRQQLLELLGADSMQALRTQAGHVWNAHYSADGQTATVLANSLWLDDAYSFHQETVDLLADSYYASVFHGDLGTEDMNLQLRTWLNQQTDGLLNEQTHNTSMHPGTVFALASTVLFHADWELKFREENTHPAQFHSPEADLTVPFMNTLTFGTYYWGEGFGAIKLALSGKNNMWLILPDPGYTVTDILKSNDYLRLTLDPGRWANQQYCKIQLSLPKFDVSCQKDLAGSIQSLGVTEVFDYTRSDFSAISDTPGLFVNKVDHAVRVCIDEKGCTAAAYTVIDLPAGSSPPKDTVTFTLDRPFLFLVSSRDSLPLFAGTVVEP